MHWLCGFKLEPAVSEVVRISREIIAYPPFALLLPLSGLRRVTSSCPTWQSCLLARAREEDIPDIFQ
jgi:hypothetical protein